MYITRSLWGLQFYMAFWASFEPVRPLDFILCAFQVDGIAVPLSGIVNRGDGIAFYLKDVQAVQPTKIIS